MQSPLHIALAALKCLNHTGTARAQESPSGAWKPSGCTGRRDYRSGRMAVKGTLCGTPDGRSDARGRGHAFAPGRLLVSGARRLAFAFVVSPHSNNSASSSLPGTERGGLTSVSFVCCDLCASRFVYDSPRYALRTRSLWSSPFAGSLPASLQPQNRKDVPTVGHHGHPCIRPLAHECRRQARLHTGRPLMATHLDLRIAHARRKDLHPR
jgi:hypothetical protein